MGWAVATARLNWERAAARSLRGLDIESYLPVYRSHRRVRALMFPRYIFVCVSKRRWPAVYKARGIVRLFMRSDDAPYLLPDDYIPKLKARENQNGVIHLEDEVEVAEEFKAGQMLRVIRGELEGLLAVYQRRVANGEEATVNMFGRATRVVFQPHQLSAAVRKN